MKPVLKVATVALLLVNGISGVYGGLSLIMYPDGSSMHLSPDLLAFSFFDSYLVPGIILLLTNGFFSIYVFAALILGHKKYWRLVALQGIILILWLVAQIALIRVIHYLHLVMFAVGAALVGIGLLSEDYRSGEIADDSV